MSNRINFLFMLLIGRWKPSVLIEGVLFRARYLGSTQLVCEGQPTKSTRMIQAEEAVSRIKVRNTFSLLHLSFKLQATFTHIQFFPFDNAFQTHDQTHI